MGVNRTESKLPLYHYALDWESFFAEYPPPDVFAETVFKWPADRIRDLQNRRFLETVAAGWKNPFFARRWRTAGIEPSDIRSLDDIVKLPTYNSDDIKDDQRDAAPFGAIPGIAREAIGGFPLKLQSSGGTTGKPRVMLHGPREWEMAALTTARGLYLQGARPGDVMQIPATCATAMLGWGFYKACHDYLGMLPLTTGSGVVTPSRRQIEIAFDYGTTCWMSFPEYLIRLAQAAKEEFGRDVRELDTKFLTTFLGPDLEGKLRRQLAELWGCEVYDNYGTNEIGLGACEGPEKDGLYVMEDCTYVEVLDTETGKPVAPGEVGNLTVTTFYRSIAPVIRFNLRDLGRFVSTGPSALGSNFRRIDHFLGRSDDMIRIRGVNVYPMACLNAVKSDPRSTGEWLCVVDRIEKDGVPRDELTIRVEVGKDAGALDGLAEHLAQRFRNDLGVTVVVELAPLGSLDADANIGTGEGKVKRLLDRRPGLKRG
jgi:phenylacetate-CoA ligase